MMIRNSLLLLLRMSPRPMISVKYFCPCPGPRRVSVSSHSQQSSAKFELQQFLFFVFFFFFLLLQIIPLSTSLQWAESISWPWRYPVSCQIAIPPRLVSNTETKDQSKMISILISKISMISISILGVGKVMRDEFLVWPRLVSWQSTIPFRNLVSKTDAGRLLLQ